MTTTDLNQVANVLNSKIAEKAYDDGLTEPVKETSKIVTNLIKAAHYILAPLQYIAARQDRLEQRLKASIEQIPEKNRIEPPTSILIPVINHLNYIEDGNILAKLYQNLLARAMDKTRISEAHPAFIVTISQLSPDEAVLLYELKFKDIKITRITDTKNIDSGDFSRLQKTDFECTDFPVEKLIFPNNFEMYISHLLSLNLVTMSIVDYDRIYDKNDLKKQVALKNIHATFLTDFGKLFLSACF